MTLNVDNFILLLTFTDFELSGQNVETEAISITAKFKMFNTF